MFIYRRFSGVLFALLMLLSVGGCGKKSGSAGFKREYRMQVTVGPTTYWGIGAAKFAELAKKKTGGRINIKPCYGSQLLKGAQLNGAQMVAEGAIDCALDSTINIAPMFPEMNIFTLLFFVKNYQNLDRLESGNTGRKLFARMQLKGLMPLAWGENGFRQLTDSRCPVRTPSDMKNLKIRVVGTPIFIDIFRALGADPVNMNWGDAVTAFQQGTVDGQENPAGILLPVRIWQYHKYATFWNYAVDPLVFYWNKDEWAAFPPEIKKALKEAAEEAGEFEKALCRAGLDGETSLNILKDKFDFTPKIKEPMRYMKSKGMEIIIPDAKAAEMFLKKVEPVTRKWVDVIGDELYETAKKDMSQVEDEAKLPVNSE